MERGQIPEIKTEMSEACRTQSFLSIEAGMYPERTRVLSCLLGVMAEGSKPSHPPNNHRGLQARDP